MRVFETGNTTCLSSGRLELFLIVLLIATTGTSTAQQSNSRPDQTFLPGRQVKVAAVCDDGFVGVGWNGDPDKALKLAIDHLHTVGRSGADIACLPEEFVGSRAESVPGPTTLAVGKIARLYNMYIICPIHEQVDTSHYNTAVLIDRNGNIAGSYRKVNVFWGENVHSSREGVKAFDTDFGRIGILTCFDLNFAELWHECALKNVEIVFWPSLYGGGQPLNAYATIHHYYIVPVGRGNIIDITGEHITDVRSPRGNLFIATLDLDRTLVHLDFNRSKIEKLVADHEGEVIIERYRAMEEWYILRSVKPGIRVRDLLREYEIEPLREYQQRSRKEINKARKEGRKI